MSNVFGITARAYRWYADGTESGAAALAAENTALDCLDDAILALRYGVQESGSGSASGATTDDYQLQVAKNGGAFQDVTGASTICRGFTSSSLTDAAATTQRLSAGTGSFVAGEISETDGLLTDWQLTANNFSELLYAIQLQAADLAPGDAVTFRVLRNGAIFNTYSVTPTLNVVAAPTTVSPDPVAAATAVPGATLEVGALASPSPVAAATAVPSSSVEVGIVITPAPVAAATAVPAPASVESVTEANPSPVAAVTAVPGATVQVGATVSPSPAAAALAVPAVTLEVGVIVTPSPAAAATDVPAATVQVGATVSPSPVPAVLDVPVPTVTAETAGATAVSPSPVAAVTAVPAATVQVGVTITPAPVPADTASPAVTVTVGVTISPAPVAAVAAVPTPTVTAGGDLGEPAEVIIVLAPAVAPDVIIERAVEVLAEWEHV